MQLTGVQTQKSRQASKIKKQVFIVDDDESICRALVLLMKSYGFETRAFSSAEDFFSAVPNSTDGCLIMDIHMPGLKGWEAHQRLLKSGSKRPVIVITADECHDLKKRSIKTGATGFFQKPVNDKELVRMLNQLSKY